MQKKLAITVVGLFVLLAVVVLVQINKDKWLPKNGVNSPQQKLEPTFQFYNASSTPPGLPTNLPLDTGAKITQNYQGQDLATGQTPSTRQYLSKKTVVENTLIYKKFLESNAWKILSSGTNLDIYSFHAQNNTGDLFITIATTTVSSYRSVVNITFQQNKILK